MPEDSTESSRKKENNLSIWELCVAILFELHRTLVKWGSVVCEYGDKNHWVVRLGVALCVSLLFNGLFLSHAASDGHQVTKMFELKELYEGTNKSVGDIEHVLLELMYRANVANAYFIILTVMCGISCIFWIANTISIVIHKTPGDYHAELLSNLATIRSEINKLKAENAPPPK